MDGSRRHGRNLDYISDIGTNDVYVYSYPKLRLEGTLTGFATASGKCIDKEGDVSSRTSKRSRSSNIAHGGTTRMATLERYRLLPLWLFHRSDDRECRRHELQ